MSTPAVARAPEDELPPGHLVAGRFRIEAPLGAGGVGVVYRAHHLGLGKPVALKVLQAEWVRTHPNAIQRFHREARAASRVDHPHAVRVLDFGAATDGTVYLAMELLDGVTLRQLVVEQGRLPLERALGRVAEVLAALDAAHTAGLVHRDVKAANVMVVQRGGAEAAVVCDFGLAKVAPEGPDDRELTLPGTVFGTPASMAPEQVRGEAATPATDVYACGALLYELLTGERPFRGARGAELAAAHLSVVPTPPSARVPEVPVAVDAIVLCAMAKQPEARFASAREMRGAVLAVLDTVETEALARTRLSRPRREGEVRPRPERTAARRSAWPAIGALSAAIAGVFAWGLGGPSAPDAPLAVVAAPSARVAMAAAPDAPPAAVASPAAEAETGDGAREAGAAAGEGAREDEDEAGDGAREDEAEAAGAATPAATERARQARDAPATSAPRAVRTRRADRAVTAEVEIVATAAGPRVHLTGDLDDTARRDLEPRLEALARCLPAGEAPASLRVGLDADGRPTALQLDWRHGRTGARLPAAAAVDLAQRRRCLTDAFPSLRLLPPR